MPESVNVVIAVLTFNGYDLARVALETLATQVGSPVPTVVIDNGSVTEEGQRLVKEFGSPVESIRLDPNRGVGGGYNAGIRWAIARGASHVLLMNNDIRAIDAEMLVQLIAATGPTVGAVAPLIEESDGGIYSAGGQISMWTGLATHKKAASKRSPYEADWLDGPCLLISLDAVRHIGPLDESLWMYWEDVEWCLRARQNGWQCLVQPATRIVHFRGGTNKRPDAEAMDLRNRLRVLRRYSSPVELALSTAFLLGVHAPIFIARRSGRGRVRHAVQAVAAALGWNLRDIARGRSWRGAAPPRWVSDQVQ